MNKKYAVCSALTAFLCGLVFTGSIFVNAPYFERLAYDKAVFYQCRQLLSILLLLCIGLFFLVMIRESLSPVWTVLLAMPVGICLWVFPSLLLLLIGISYTFFNTILIIAAILGALAFVRMRRPAVRHKYYDSDSRTPAFGRMAAPSVISPADRSPAFWQEATTPLLLLLGAAFFVSSGLIYVFVSYDSYFYFTNYGNTLTIVKNFRDIVGENSFTLTNISQFLPLLNAYTAFWRLDQAFQIQAFLTINILACFFWGLYQYALHTSAGNTFFTPKLPPRCGALLFSALLTLFLATSTSFLVASAWVLANMYCMAYLFFSMLLLEPSFGRAKKEACILASLFFTALTLLRKDGIIFVCFLLVYFALKSRWNRSVLFILFLPSIVSELWWLFYVRVVLKATVEQAAFTSIANNANVAFVIAAIAATCLYLFLLHPLFDKRLPFSETWLLYGGLMLLLAVLTLRDWNQVIDNVDMTIRNMLLYPSSWGISAVLFGILLVFTLLYRPFWDTDTFLWLGYVLLNFISYCAVGKNLWVNWDDSYNRIVLQIIPIFVFICGKKLSCLLQSYTPDHNSGS